MGKCSVKDIWFNKTDSNGRMVSEYAIKENKHSIFCKVCATVINCSKGFQAIQQHSQKQKLANVKLKLNPLQLHLEAKTSTATVLNNKEQGNTKIVNVYSTKDEAIRAELVWAMNVVAQNNSSSSCNNITNVFEAMFTQILPNFSMSRTKVTYYITEALGPFFRQELLDDILKENCFYSIQFDETTSNGGNKECQISIRYWSSTENASVSRFLESFFIGHGTAEILREQILKALNNANLPFSRMLMVGSDGPVVNQKVFRLLNADVMADPNRDNNKSLLNIGTCNLHIMHNAFEKGLSKFGKKVEDLFINLYYYFNDYPSRKEDYRKIQVEKNVPLHAFIKHVPSRWLTLGPVAERVTEQYPALLYFFETITKKSSTKLNENDRIVKIVNALKNPSIRAEVLFVSESAQLFENFCKLFQKQEPLIHILYEEARNIVTIILNKICKPETVKQFNKLKNLFDIKNMLSVKDIKCSDKIDEVLKKLSERDELQFRYNVQQHYKAAAEHLLSKSILNFETAKHFRFLQPHQLKKPEIISSIAKVNRVLPLGISESRLLDEWFILQHENMPIFTHERIDHYWKKIFDIKNSMGEPKFPLVTKIVKASFSLIHGSADVERHFSDSGNQLTKERAAMSIKTLNSRMIIKDALKKYNNKPDQVLITKQLITMGRSAHSRYKAYLEEQRKIETEKKRKEDQKEEEKKMQEQLIKDQIKRRNNISVLEAQYKEVKQENDSNVKAREKLLEEGINRIQNALKKNDLEEMKIAHGLLQGAQIMKLNLDNSEVEPLRKKLEKCKSTLVTNFFKKARIESSDT